MRLLLDAIRLLFRRDKISFFLNDGKFQLNLLLWYMNLRRLALQKPNGVALSHIIGVRI